MTRSLKYSFDKYVTESKGRKEGILPDASVLFILVIGFGVLSNVVLMIDTVFFKVSRWC